MKNNIFVIFTAFLAVVVVALLFTIATLQSENSDLRNVIRNQTNNSIYVNRSVKSLAGTSIVSARDKN